MYEWVNSSLIARDTSEEDCKIIAKSIFNRRNSEVGWIEIVDGKITLCSISGPHYDDQSEYLNSSSYETYKELLRDNINQLVVNNLREGQVTSFLTIGRRTSVNFTRYESSKLVVSASILRQLGLYDWVVDYHRNNSLLELEKEKFKSLEDVKITSKEDFDKALDDYFLSYLKRKGKFKVLEYLSNKENIKKDRFKKVALKHGLSSYTNLTTGEISIPFKDINYNISMSILSLITQGYILTANTKQDGKYYSLISMENPLTDWSNISFPEGLFKELCISCGASLRTRINLNEYSDSEEVQSQVDYILIKSSEIRKGGGKPYLGILLNDNTLCFVNISTGGK